MRSRGNLFREPSASVLVFGGDAVAADRWRYIFVHHLSSLIQHMGRIQLLNSSSSTSAMDIDPRSSTWNSLCPTFLDSKRNRIHLQDDSSGHVIGSPPPAGSPQILWDNFPVEVPNVKPREINSSNVPVDKGTAEASELSLRVQEIRLQPQQPMIICETIEDERNDSSEMMCSDTVSLSVPPVDVTNEKKRPPISAPY